MLLITVNIMGYNVLRPETDSKPTVRGAMRTCNPPAGLSVLPPTRSLSQKRRIW